MGLRQWDHARPPQPFAAFRSQARARLTQHPLGAEHEVAAVSDVAVGDAAHPGCGLSVRPGRY
jgi:hypothetical protein